MIVCSCKVLSHPIEDAGKGGIKWKKLVRDTGLATVCGRCAVHAMSIYDKAKAERKKKGKQSGRSGKTEGGQS